jgi:hypothetical protein
MLPIIAAYDVGFIAKKRMHSQLKAGVQYFKARALWSIAVGPLVACKVQSTVETESVARSKRSRTMPLNRKKSKTSRRIVSRLGVETIASRNLTIHPTATALAAFRRRSTKTSLPFQPHGRPLRLSTCFCRIVLLQRAALDVRPASTALMNGKELP